MCLTGRAQSVHRRALKARSARGRLPRRGRSLSCVPAAPLNPASLELAKAAGVIPSRSPMDNANDCPQGERAALGIIAAWCQEVGSSQSFALLSQAEEWIGRSGQLAAKLLRLLNQHRDRGSSPIPGVGGCQSRAERSGRTVETSGSHARSRKQSRPRFVRVAQLVERPLLSGRLQVRVLSSHVQRDGPQHQQSRGCLPVDSREPCTVSVRLDWHIGPAKPDGPSRCLSPQPRSTTCQQ